MGKIGLAHDKNGYAIQGFAPSVAIQATGGTPVDVSMYSAIRVGKAVDYRINGNLPVVTMPVSVTVLDNITSITFEENIVFEAM